MDPEEITNMVEASLTGTSLSAPADEIPQGPAGRAADTVLAGIREAGVTSARLENEGSQVMVEFYPNDQDPHYPAVVTFDSTTGRVTEVTLRFGPLGDRAETERRTIYDLEGKWVDAVLDAASKADILGVIDGNDIDLGDEWVAPELRPHVRLRRREDGYDISPQEFVEFYDILQQRFRSKFGTLEDRRLGMATSGSWSLEASPTSIGRDIEMEAPAGSPTGHNADGIPREDIENIPTEERVFTASEQTLSRARRLARLPFVFEVSTSSMASSGDIIDFIIDYPSAPSLRMPSDDDFRTMARSSISLTEDGDVRSATFRYPPIDPDITDDQRGRWYDAGDGPFSLPSEDPTLFGFANDLWPHVDWTDLDTADATFEDVVERLQGYSDLYTATFSPTSSFSAPDPGMDRPPEPPERFVEPDVYSYGGPIEEGGINSSDRGPALTGLWFPDENNIMLAGGDDIHGRLFNVYVDNLGFDVPDRVMGFKAIMYNGYTLEIPGGGGGLYQGLSKRGLNDDVKRITGASINSPEALYPCIYAARLLDAPDNDDSLVRYGHRVTSSVEDSYNTTDEYRLGDCYQEMRFSGILPEPFVDSRLSAPTQSHTLQSPGFDREATADALRRLDVVRDVQTKTRDNGGSVEFVIPTVNDTVEMRPYHNSAINITSGVLEEGAELTLRFPAFPMDTFDTRDLFAMSRMFDNMSLVTDRREHVRRDASDSAYHYHLERDVYEMSPEEIADGIEDAVEVFRTRVAEYEEFGFSAPNPVADRLKGVADDVRTSGDFIDFRLPVAKARTEGSSVNIPAGRVTRGIIRGPLFNPGDVTRRELEEAILTAAPMEIRNVVEARVEGGGELDWRPHASVYGEVGLDEIIALVQGMEREMRYLREDI